MCRNWLVIKSSTNYSVRWSNTETECVESLRRGVDYLSSSLVSLMSLCPFSVRLLPSVPNAQTGSEWCKMAVMDNGRRSRVDVDRTKGKQRA